MDCGCTIIIFLAFIQATCGQSVTLEGPSDVEQGMDAVYTCTLTGGTAPYIFLWRDLSVVPNVVIFNGGKEAEPTAKHGNFEISENGPISTMTIRMIEIEDEGLYRCSESSANAEKNVSVEVGSTISCNLNSTVENKVDIYVVECDALGARPEETITWMQSDGGSPCDGTPVETPLQAGPGLSSKRSVCTFQATNENNGEIVRFITSGHQLTDLNGEETITLNIHSAPRNDIMTVEFEDQNPGLRVTCYVADADQPNPIMRNYNISRNGTLIHQSDTGDNSVDVPESDFDLNTEFLCVAWNYLGNTTSDPTKYEPRTTTPSPPTDMMTSPEPNDGNETGPPSGPGGLSAGATAGIAIGAVLLIVIIVLIIYFVWKKGKDGLQGLFTSCNCCLRCCNCCLPCCNCCLPPSAASSTKKHGSSAVGTSNGSEKDKIKPVAAPRDQGSIQHTTDNPGQAEYAMVDRKKPGGDMPDTRGPGQKEPQGMLYADLDLSASAGHTEKKVPQNKDDVVVYSSILV